MVIVNSNRTRYMHYNNYIDIIMNRESLKRAKVITRASDNRGSRIEMQFFF